MQNVWSSSLFDCAKDEETCWWSTWCCCVVSGRTSQQFGLSPSQEQISRFLGVCLLAIVLVIIGLGPLGVLAIIIGLGVLAYQRTMIRLAIRDRLTILGSFMGDLNIHAFCSCCAVAQEAREAVAANMASLDYCSGQVGDPRPSVTLASPCSAVPLFSLALCQWSDRAAWSAHASCADQAAHWPLHAHCPLPCVPRLLHLLPHPSHPPTSLPTNPYPQAMTELPPAFPSPDVDTPSTPLATLYATLSATSATLCKAWCAFALVAVFFIAIASPLSLIVLLLVFAQPALVLYFVYWPRRLHVSADMIVKLFTVGFFMATSQAMVLEYALEGVLGIAALLVLMVLASPPKPAQMVGVLVSGQSMLASVRSMLPDDSPLQPFFRYVSLLLFVCVCVESTMRGDVEVSMQQQAWTLASYLLHFYCAYSSLSFGPVTGSLLLSPIHYPSPLDSC